MKKEVFEQIKKELIMLAVIFLVAFLAFKLIFSSEDFFIVLRTVMAIFWLLVVPGFVIMFYWNEELKFYERLIIGIGFGTVLIGLLSYYTGLMGLHVKYHMFVLPTTIIAIGIIINLRK